MTVSRSVDAEAEYLIQQALEQVLKGRTALVIAHRLSTIRNADKIIVLEGGRIREVGSHRELLARGGLYSQLYQRQLEMAAEGGNGTDADSSGALYPAPAPPATAGSPHSLPAPSRPW